MTDSVTRSLYFLALLVWAAAAIFGIRTFQWTQRSETASGIVKSIAPSGSSNAGRALVEFVTTSGVKAEFHTANWLKSTYGIGDAVEVLYEPGHPEAARVNSPFSLYLVPGILAMIGSDILIGTFILSHTRKSKSERQKLQFTGQAIMAKYLRYRVIPNASTVIPNRYEIEAEWTDPNSGKTYYFTSEPSTKNSTDSLHEGQQVTVYIDPANPKKYYFELPVSA